MFLKRLAIAALAAAFAFFLSSAPSEAKGGGQGRGGAAKPAKTVKPQTKVGGKVQVSHGKAQTQRAAKTTKVTTKSTQRAAKSTQPAGSKKTRTATADKGKTLDKNKTSKRTARSNELVPTDGTDTPLDPLDPTLLNKTQQKLAQNGNLRAKLQARLPVGTDLMAAAAGFRNLGQFVAAVNVAYNHGISFDALKLRMTGPEPMSLGQALQQVKGLNAAVAGTTAQTALAQAEADIEATTTTTSRKPAKRRS